MKKLLSAFVLMISVLGAFAQETPAELKNAGNAKLKEKDYAGALELFEKYVVADAEAAAADNATNYNMGYCGYKSKSYDKSIKYFATSIEKGYKAEKAYLYTAYSHLKLKDKDAYLATLEAGLEKYPNSASLKKTYAKHFVKQGKASYDKGAKILSAAANDVAANKYTTESDNYKTAVANAKKAFSSAIPSLDKALELVPGESNATKIKAAVEKNLSTL